jgi:hypothetical protein
MRINEYLNRADEQGDGPHDPKLEALLGGKPDSTAAGRFWAAVADGSALVDDTLAWAQQVARRVVADVVNGPDRDAAPAALKAIGFYGRIDKHRTARDYLALIAEFDVLDEQGNPLPPERLPASQWLRLLRRAGHLAGVPDKTAINQINTWRKELGIE